MSQIPFEVGTIVPPLEARTPDGSRFVLDQIDGNGILLVFIRHINCIACQYHLTRLKRWYAAFQKQGFKILVVSLSQPWVLKMYQEARTFPFPFVADPELHRYHDYGLERASTGVMLRPRVVAHYLGIILQGWWVRMPKEGEDVLQLGGDFLLDRQRKLSYAHRCQAPSDRPSPRRLLQEMTRIATPAP